MAPERAYLSSALGFLLGKLPRSLAFFLTASSRLGRFAAFLAAFFAAGLWRLRAGAAFFGAATLFPVAAGAMGAMVDAAMLGMAGFSGVIGAAAGALMASSQPGVNISSRSREIALARPQRGQRAS
jgi:hypothetical protein